MRLLSLLLFVLVPSVGFAETCTDLGFADTLVCSSCEKLEAQIHDEDLIKECKSCCADDLGSPSQQLFQSADLQFCYCNLDRFPEVKNFVEKKASNFPNLSLVQIRGITPTLVMKSKSDGAETMSITKWSSDDIQAYLRTKMTKPEIKVEQ